MREKDKELSKEALKVVYHDEIVKTGSIMRRKFLGIDEKQTGKITINDLRKSMATCALLTPKE